MKEKMGTIFVLCTLAFAGIGIGYAHWSEILTINGSVETGSIDPIFYCVSTNDPTSPGSNDPKECGGWDIDTTTWDGERYDKNVGAIDASIDPQDSSQLYITVTNAYPCYYGSVLFSIKNVGTVPVKIKSIKLVKIDRGDWWKNVNVELDKDTTYYVDFEATRVATTPSDGDDFSFSISLIEPGLQIDSDEIKYGDICVHVEQGAKQNTEYSCVIKVDFWNWNEVM